VDIRTCVQACVRDKLSAAEPAAGYKQVFEGMGLPKPGSKESTNLIVEFHVVFPRRLTDEQREILKDIMNEDEIEVRSVRSGSVPAFTPCPCAGARVSHPLGDGA